MENKTKKSLSGALGAWLIAAAILVYDLDDVMELDVLTYASVSIFAILTFYMAQEVLGFMRNRRRGGDTPR
ncbi:hypothetical protein [Streptomyces sp. NPDC096068]|uniref:hypothetical protein n=1 Tax=Streptomyces sp. NPDC096068 TaxID=3155424 RepID=UPI00331FE131